MLRPTARKVPPPATECPMTLCVDLLAGSWTPHILWYLRGGPRRFGDLRRDIAGISAKVLTERLRALEARLMVKRTVVDTSPPTTEYALTPLGERFTPILDAILEVGDDIVRSRGHAAEAREQDDAA